MQRISEFLRVNSVNEDEPLLPLMRSINGEVQSYGSSSLPVVEVVGREKDPIQEIEEKLERLRTTHENPYHPVWSVIKNTRQSSAKLSMAYQAIVDSSINPLAQMRITDMAREARHSSCQTNYLRTTITGIFFATAIVAYAVSQSVYRKRSSFLTQYQRLLMG